MRHYWISVVILGFGPLAHADVKPHALFTDHAVLQRDRPIVIWGTADPGEDVTVSYRHDSAGTKADDKGNWKVSIRPYSAADGADMVIQGKNKVVLKDVAVGEVWVCSGQSNMEWRLNQCTEADANIPAAKIPRLRLFTVPRKAASAPQATVESSWKECTPENAAGFSGVAYFFGRNLCLNLNVPVGLIHTSWGGTPAEAWTSREALDAEPSLKYYHEQFQKKLAAYNPAKAKADHEAALEKHKAAVAKAKVEKKSAPKTPQIAANPATRPNPSTLYNAMIHPLLNFPIRGAIWYQGESNGSKGFEYRTLFPTMIKDWRQRWGQGDFPFLCVQLAPFAAFNNADGPQWAELREAQDHAAKSLPKVGVAVITDVGEKNDIHPPKKEPVGARLALLARRIAYGEELISAGPVFNSMTQDGNKLVLSFDNVGNGLDARGGPLKDFTICGEDRKFVPAKAEIKSGTVIVWADGVEKPIAVRYGWRNCPECNLFNKRGLPAGPFRTDDYPLTSAPMP